MANITAPPARAIVEDFASEIQSRKQIGPVPTKAVINFRNEQRDKVERQIYNIPLGLLRYRKDNGRIASDVLNYERNVGPLREDTEEAQQIIKRFLFLKDRERTEELTRSMQHEGQREPAIITCDGFLINGNRRKMVLEMLAEKLPGDSRFITMKVILLPGRTDTGGPPTLLEIEELENRYQLQSDGKAEYYGFDRALSMRRKISLGMTLEAQLRDDSSFAGLNEKEFKEAVKRHENDYLKPLDAVDRYLASLGRDGLYVTVSAGLSDREGRWQAFLDYSKFYEQLKDERRRFQLGINESEVGRIEDIAFKLIRKRELVGLPKVHKVMRDLPKLLKDVAAKKELMVITDLSPDLEHWERFDKNGKEYELRQQDRIWGEKNATSITRQVTMAYQARDYDREREAPIGLLRASLEKLNHDDMEDPVLNDVDLPEAMRLSRDIRNRAEELEHFFFDMQKTKKGD